MTASKILKFPLRHFMVRRIGYSERHASTVCVTLLGRCSSSSSSSSSRCSDGSDGTAPSALQCSDKYSIVSRTSSAGASPYLEQGCLRLNSKLLKQRQSSFKSLLKHKWTAQIAVIAVGIRIACYKPKVKYGKYLIQSLQWNRAMVLVIQNPLTFND